MATYGSVSDILDAEDQESKDILVPEWGGKTFRIMVMDGNARDRFDAQYQAAQADPAKATGLRGVLVGSCLVDDEGKRLFSDNDIRKLAKKSSKVLTRLYMECIKLNLLDEETKEVEAEDFTPDQSEDSGTA